MQRHPLLQSQRSARRSSSMPYRVDDPASDASDGKVKTNVRLYADNNDAHSDDRDDDSISRSSSHSYSSDRADRQRLAPKLPLSARSASMNMHERHIAIQRSTSQLAMPAAAALPMKQRRLQHALVDAQQRHLASEALSHTRARNNNIEAANDAAAETSDVLLQQIYNRCMQQQQNALVPHAAASLAFNGFCTREHLTIARDALQYVVIELQNAAATVDTATRERLVRAVARERLVRAVAPDAMVEATDNATKQLDVHSWYKLGRVVGNGTFGRVTSARHRLSGTHVAIKSYFRTPNATVCCRAPTSGAAAGPRTSRTSSSSRPTAATNADTLDWKRVRHEVQMMATHSPHASIVRFIEAFETPVELHIVMEFVAGETLCDYMQRRQRQQQQQQQQRRTRPRITAPTNSKSSSSKDASLKLDDATARTIFGQLCAAVASLHEQHIIHRDLKLENVLIDTNGHSKLIDFGFSQLDEPTSSLRSNKRSAAAATPSTVAPPKNFCGTPSYMAPEVVACERYDGTCADVWSLGVVLYVLLCGKFPFQGQSFQQLFYNMRATPCAFNGADRTVSSAAQALVRSLLAVDPQKRPRVRDVLLHPWMIAAPTAFEKTKRHDTRVRDDLRFCDAFLQWAEAPVRVCAALEELYGVSAAVLLEAVQSTQRRSGGAALVRLVVLAVEKLCVIALQQRTSDTISMNDASSCSDTLTNESHVQSSAPSPLTVAAAQTDASNHKQRLENLIGLVKASLTV